MDTQLLVDSGLALLAPASFILGWKLPRKSPAINSQVIPENATDEYLVWSDKGWKPTGEFVPSNMNPTQAARQKTRQTGVAYHTRRIKD